MLRTMERKGKGYIIELNRVEKIEQSTIARESYLTDISWYLKPIVEQKAAVFTAPAGLPSTKGLYTTST